MTNQGRERAADGSTRDGVRRLSLTSSGYDAVAGSPGRNLMRLVVGQSEPATFRETVVVGLAAKFNVPVPAPSSTGALLFRPGAFLRAIATRPISLLLMHAETSPIIASTTDRTLSLWESGDGLMFRLNPSESLAAREVLRHAQRGAYTGASVGFRPHLSISVETEGLSAYVEAVVDEISLVSKGTMPRFRDTWVKTMSLAESLSLEDAACTDVVMRETRGVSYGGQDRFLHADEAYRLPTILAGLLVTAGSAIRKEMKR